LSCSCCKKMLVARTATISITSKREEVSQRLGDLQTYLDDSELYEFCEKFWHLRPTEPGKSYSFTCHCEQEQDKAAEKEFQGIVEKYFSMTLDSFEKTDLEWQISYQYLEWTSPSVSPDVRPLTRVELEEALSSETRTRSKLIENREDKQDVFSAVTWNFYGSTNAGSAALRQALLFEVCRIHRAEIWFLIEPHKGIANIVSLLPQKVGDEDLSYFGNKEAGIFYDKRRFPDPDLKGGDRFVSLSSKINGNDYVFVSYHGPYTGLDPYSRKIKTLELLKSLDKEYPDSSVIVGGDFNFEIDNITDSELHKPWVLVRADDPSRITKTTQRNLDCFFFRNCSVSIRHEIKLEKTKEEFDSDFFPIESLTSLREKAKDEDYFLACDHFPIFAVISAD